MLKLYTTDGGSKLVRRKSGAIERLHYLNIGKLPVGYTSEPDGKILYILDDSVISYQRELGGSREWDFDMDMGVAGGGGGSA